MRRIWWAPNNASKWQMELNSAFKSLITITWWAPSVTISPDLLREVRYC
jgi:hypothetical protein